MSKILALMILFNVLLGIAFVFSNYYIWNSLEEYPYTTDHWSPFMISYVQRYLVNGELVSIQTIRVIPNYPFWLFWVAMIGNILFAVFILRSKEKPKKSH